MLNLFRIGLTLLLVVVSGVRLTSAQDLSSQSEYAAFDYETSLDELARGDCDCAACTCGAHRSCWTRPTLTGDWHGYRPGLQQSGVTFRGNVTQFGFAIDGGIDVPVPAPFGQGDTAKYTGRGEYDLIFDLEKFGGMPKGRLLVRAQH